jgi:hypothetical protein
MLQTTVQEFHSADALMAHYATLRQRMREPLPAKDKAAPAPLPTPAKQTGEAPDTAEVKCYTMTLEDFLEQISCGKLVASQANGMRLAKLLDVKWGLPVGSVQGRSRTRPTILARQEWYYILVKVWGWPYGQTGRYTQRDHTSVLHGVAKHIARLQAQAN